MEITTSEFFCNMKKLPPPGSQEFIDLIKWEEAKIKGGVTINGVFITPWLYWHLNHWKIRIDSTDNYGNEIRIESLPELRDNEWIRAEYLEQCRLQKKGYMEIGGRQGGKALPNEAILYTENGEIQIGDCNIGDRIYDESGKLTTITGKFPQGIRPCYRMNLLDGRVLVSDENHKWLVKDRFSKKKDKTVVKTTKELFENYRRERKSWNNRKNKYEYRYSIPNNKAVEYTEKEQILDPYFLGLWLGDGSNTYSKITTIDKEIENYIRQYATSVGLQVTIDDKDTFMVTSGKMGGNKKEKESRNFIHQYLKSLYNNKHIPKEYLYGSIEQRMELLRGLMDSDGCCDKTGSITFSSSIPQLAKDFYKLCRGLGIVLKCKEKETFYKKDSKKVKCKNSFNFTLFTDLPIFKLSRKLNNIKCKPKYKDWIGISYVGYIGETETTCITVDNDSHLFLMNHYTPTHNSEMEGSYFGMNAIMFKLTQNVIVCGNDNDLSLLKDKVDFGLKNVWEGINIPRLDKTWRSNQIRLGYKKPNGDDEVWSYIVIRNAKDGHNTEVSAGTTAKTFIMDEVGKYPFSQAYEAGVPAMKGANGFRAVPILVGTGGSFDNGKDAENFFLNPEANNFLAVQDEKTNKKTCVFLSGLYRQDCKIESNLADYLISKGVELKDTTELKKIKIKVSDKELAQKTIEQEREAAKKNPDRTIYLKKVMYYPLTIEECFLSNYDNIFDIEAAKRQKARLLQQERQGYSVILFQDENGNVKHEFTDKQPISNFPLKPSDSKDAPVVIYEFPSLNPQYGLYTAGVDSYRVGKAEYSDSLGSIYIFKRIHSLIGENYQDMIVASYVARPEKKEKWEEQARLLIKLFNARTLIENDEISFIDHMISKKEAHYLEPQPQWLKTVVPNTTVTRDYGIHRSAEKIRNHLHGILKAYLEEDLIVEKNEQGEVIRRVQGIHKIPDVMLLEEIIQYNDEGNFDRVVAFELALAQAKYMDPIMGKVEAERSSKNKSIKSNKYKGSLFDTRSNGMFPKLKSKLWL